MPRIPRWFTASGWAGALQTRWLFVLWSAGSKVKQSRKEKEAELAEVIAELALQVEIKGSCRKPTWRDQPVVLLAMLPVHTST